MARAKTILTVVWKTLNSPFVLTLLVSVLIGGYYLPMRLTTAQVNYQEQLRQDTARYSFSVELLDLAWKRLFLAKNYCWNFDSAAQEVRQSYWEEYYETVKEWNYSFVSTEFAIRKYYGEETSVYFTTEVHQHFLELHDSLLALDSEDTCINKESQDLIDTLNNRLYILAEQMNYIQ